MACRNQCAVGSGGKSVGYLAHGTATDYMYETLKVPLAFTWEIYGDAAAPYEDCFRMFNPVTRQGVQQVWWGVGGGWGWGGCGVDVEWVVGWVRGCGVDAGWGGWWGGCGMGGEAVGMHVIPMYIYTLLHFLIYTHLALTSNPPPFACIIKATSPPTHRCLISGPAPSLCF